MPCGFFYAYCTWLWSGQLCTLWFFAAPAWQYPEQLGVGGCSMACFRASSNAAELVWQYPEQLGVAKRGGKPWPWSGCNVLMFAFDNVLMFAFDNVLMFAFDNVLMFVIEWNWMFVLLIIWDAFGVFECSKKGLMFCESSYKVRFFWRQNEH